MTAVPTGATTGKVGGDNTQAQALKQRAIPGKEVMLFASTRSVLSPGVSWSHFRVLLLIDTQRRQGDTSPLSMLEIAICRIVLGTKKEKISI